MRLLLDTHALIWWLADDSSLGPAARDAMAAPSSDVFVSAASAWEIAIKKSMGKLDAPDDLEEQLARHGFTPLPITIGHALAAGALPPHHQDPFDRVLIAQAGMEGLVVATRDSRFESYGIPLLVV